MKCVFLLGIILSLNCFAGEFVEIYPEFVDGTNRNGLMIHGDNETTFTSHIPDYQYGRDCEKHYCRKADVLYQTTPWTAGRETKYIFDLRINKYNQFAGPEWIILFQDWIKIDASDPNGNHPITTLKLKPMSNGRIKLAHFENSWQFNYSPINPIDPSDPYDYNHNHAPNIERGSIIMDDMDILEWFRIELTIRDGMTITEGSVELKIDNRVVSDVAYQTKNIDNQSHVAMGMYWSKYYNTEYNYCANWYADELDCKSTSITIRDLHIYER